MPYKLATADTQPAPNHLHIRRHRRNEFLRYLALLHLHNSFKLKVLRRFYLIRQLIIRQLQAEHVLVAEPPNRSVPTEIHRPLHVSLNDLEEALRAGVAIGVGLEETLHHSDKARPR